MSNNNFYDWLLLKIDIDWQQSSILILLKNLNAEFCHIQAKNFYEINIPKLDNWGKSSSILDMKKTKNKDKFILDIQMQSGDKLRIIANNIEPI